MPRYILGARGHDYGTGAVKDILLREEAVPAMAEKYQEFMKKCMLL